MAPPPLKTDDVPPTEFTQIVTPTSHKKAPNPSAQDVDDQVSETKTNDEIESVAFSQLYRYATPMDKALLGLGVVMAGIGGALVSCMAIVFGNAINAFAQADGGVDRDAVNSAALGFFLIAVALFVAEYASGVIFAYTAERQMKELRAEVLRHLLYLDISWYDKSDPLQLSSRLTGDTVKVKDGMGQKLGDAVKFACQFFAGYVIGFVRGWDITLAMSCLMPLMVGSMGVLLKIIQKRAVHSQQMYAEAGAVAEETLGSIRTVSSLNAEKRAIAKYNERASAAEETNIQVGKLSSIAFGFFIGCVWLMYAVGLWYGGSKVARAEASPSDVFQAFFGVLLGTMSLGQIKPNISAIAEAKGAAATIYKILDTASAIDASDEHKGEKPDHCAGRIQATNVNFTYPSRPDVQILNDYNVTIEPGQTVAFVGSSGGGPHDELVAIEHGFYRKLYTIQEEKAQEEANAVAATRIEPEGNQPLKARRLSSHSVNGDEADLKTFASSLEGDESTTKFSIWDAIAFSRPERNTFAVGILASAIMGCAMPISAVLISEMLVTMTTKYAEYQSSNSTSSLDDLKHDVMVYGLCYFGGAVVVFASAFAQNYTFKYMAEKLTSRLRSIHFTALCRQNIAFFDEKKNATGALTTDLSTNATKVALISGDSQGRVVQIVFTFAAALVVSFSMGSWLLTLVMLAVFPFLVVGNAARGKHMKTAGGLSDELSDVGAKASEALSNIRTVASLGLEKSLSGKFSDLLQEPLSRGRREAHVNGLALGFGSFILFAAYALAFWYGGKLVDDGDITFKELTKTLMAIIMSAQSIGMAATYIADSDHALKAGKAIVQLRDRSPPIDSFDESGTQPANLEGKIEFRNVLFRCF
ncbi:ABC transporter B family member 2 [Phytophthora ramorum]|uniref:ABC transporter B family member 2 n=1 Tax=Phytophthora ramorum TaxID=164328 RepID=UPI00309FBB71|nr:ABC transporter B family member 2 [Phytophthora ramorum]